MQSGPAIKGSGGMVQVCVAGSPSKATLTDKDGAALANPVSLTRGSAVFYTANAVPQVDLYIMAPDGQFVCLYAVQGDTLNEVPVDRSQINQVMRIPFSIADSTTSVEKDSGFDIPNNSIILPDAAIQTITLESGKTIDVGLLSTETNGDADGFIVGISLTTAIITAAKSASTATRGALLGGSTLDKGYSADVGVARSVSYTLASTVTAAKGFIILPYLNLATGQPTI